MAGLEKTTVFKEFLKGFGSFLNCFKSF